MKIRSSTLRLTQTAILMALLVVCACIPLRTLGLEITFSVIPVAIGAILMGPGSGALLGAVFGLCSFAQCFGWFCPSPFGAMLVGLNPFLTFLVCVPTRALMGFCVGWIFKGMKSVDRTRSHIPSFTVANLAAALLNTLFFMTALMVLFGQSEIIQNFRAQSGTSNVLTFVLWFVGVNGLIEALVSFFLGTTLSKALDTALKHIG